MGVGGGDVGGGEGWGCPAAGSDMLGAGLGSLLVATWPREPGVPVGASRVGGGVTWGAAVGVGLGLGLAESPTYSQSQYWGRM